jgi:acyl-CoA thioesterase
MRAANLRAPEDLDGTPGNGRGALWVHNPWGSDAQAAALAIVGDFVPLGIGQAVGRLFEGNSLDNTLRMVRVHPTEWILADIRVHGLAEGFGHGLVHLWAEDGTLLATASQSAIVRNPRKAT